MTKLYILRHGIAVPHGTLGMTDDERPLTAEGEKKTHEIGKGLNQLDLQLDRIVTSPVLRARRTAEIVAEELGMSDRLGVAAQLSTSSSATAIREWLREQQHDRLMIVGHNPTLSDLIGLLVLQEMGRLPIELKKGGMAVLSKVGAAGSRYELEWLVPPTLLRRLKRK